MTTTQTTPETLPVLTNRGVRIPLVGTICCHPSIGFGEVISRTQTTVRIRCGELDSMALPVVLNAGKKNESTISRSAWLSRLSDADLQRACIEIASLEARRDATPIEVESDAGTVMIEGDALVGATAFVKSLVASIEASVREADEMTVSIDAAERCGWEFDEFATFTPLKNIKKATAPKPVVVQPAEVVELEDDTRPAWLVDELNACYGDNWIPNAKA